MRSASYTASSQGKPDVLVIPKGPEPLDQDDYPCVLYWRESDWATHCERQKDLGRTMPKLGFLTDDEGNPVAESRMKKFMSHAKHAWNELYRLRLDPASWTKKTPRAASYFSHIMKTDFPEFGYCEGDWKVERFAIIKYPDWCRDAHETGQLTRAFQFSPLDLANVVLLFKELGLRSTRVAMVRT